MNSIIWLKWCDPNAPLINGRVAKPYKPEEDEENPQYYKALASFGKAGRPPQTAKGLRPWGAIMTPIGAIPIHESNLPGAIFNFWMGHTNFRVTEQAKEMIIGVPGVECIDVFTPYRFRIAVGKAFCQEEVMRAIDAAFAQPPVSPAKPKADGLEAIKTILGKRYQFWFIYKSPNGSFGHVGFEKLEEAKDNATRFDEVVAKSWEK